MTPSSLENFHVICTGLPWVEGLTIGAVLRQTARGFPPATRWSFRQAGSPLYLG